MGAAPQWKETLHEVDPGPRVRMAVRLWASGAVASKKAACEAVGLHPNYLSMLDAAGNEVVRRIATDVEAAIEDDTVALSRIIQVASRKALKTLNSLMDSNDDSVALKASSDILDRNPETSKSFKAVIGTFSLDSADAKDLARTLVESARIKERLAGVAPGDYVQVELESGEKDLKIPQGATAHRKASEAEGASDGEEGQATQGPAKVEFVLIQGGADGQEETRGA